MQLNDVIFGEDLTDPSSPRHQQLTTESCAHIDKAYNETEGYTGKNRLDFIKRIWIVRTLLKLYIDKISINIMVLYTYLLEYDGKRRL